MKRVFRLAMIAVPVMMLASPSFAEVKTRDRSQLKFEGMLGRMFNLLGGKSAKEGVETRSAVKGNRKAVLSDTTGTIIDLSEEKVYELDIKKKEYRVKTFEQIRKEMREAAERAAKEAEKAEPGEKSEAQKPAKELEVDFDVKETGQKKQIAGYDTKNAIVTITVREKGYTLDEAGGMVMTTDMWLGPDLPQMKEFAEFDLKYWQKLEGPQAAQLSAQQMAMVMAMFPLFGKASERMAKEGNKLAGSPLETTMTLEAVKSKDQLIQAQAQQQQQKPSGLGGLLAKKIIKQEEPKARSIVFTSTHSVLELATTVAPADLAIPADYKEKK